MFYTEVVLRLGGAAETETQQAGSSADTVFDQLVSSMARLPANELIAAASRFEQRLAVLRLAAAADLVGGSGDIGRDRRQARTALRVPGTSARSVAVDARRAAAVANNQVLAGQLVAGGIVPESIDGLNRAADADSGAIAPELVSAVAGLSPDETRRLVDVYLEDQVDGDAVEDRYRAQMKQRRIRRYRIPAEAGRPELAGLGIEGPDAEIERLLAEINAMADNAYQCDGGRDQAAATHRTLDQRRFDAVIAVFGFGGETPSVQSRAGSSRPTVVITVDAADLQSGAGKAQMLGVGPISDDVLKQWSADCDLVTMILGADRVPLWMGRTRRHASRHQFLALAVRDRACVLCCAPIGRCDAHHLTPWTSPAQGRTDVNDMALLCQRCHRDLHHRNHTLYRHSHSAGSVVWRTRPASPDETPASPCLRASRPPPQRE